MSKYKELLKQIESMNHLNVNNVGDRLYKNVLNGSISTEEYCVLLKMYLDKKYR